MIFTADYSLNISMKKFDYLILLNISGNSVLSTMGVIASLYNHSEILLSMALFATFILNGCILIIKTATMLGKNHFLSNISSSPAYAIVANGAVAVFFIFVIGYYMWSGSDFMSPILSVFILLFLFFICLISMIPENENR